MSSPLSTAEIAAALIASGGAVPTQVNDQNGALLSYGLSNPAFVADAAGFPINSIIASSPVVAAVGDVMLSWDTTHAASVYFDFSVTNTTWSARLRGSMDGSTWYNLPVFQLGNQRQGIVQGGVACGSGHYAANTLGYPLVKLEVFTVGTGTVPTAVGRKSAFPVPDAMAGLFASATRLLPTQSYSAGFQIVGRPVSLMVARLRNNAAADRWVHFTPNTTYSSSNLVESIRLAASDLLVMPYGPGGLACATGLAMAVTTDAAGATFTGVSAGDVTGTVVYA